MKIILNKNEQSTIEEMKDFLKNLTVEEQQKINIFVQGVNFAQKIEEKETV